MAEPTITPPPGGATITIAHGKLNVPANPIIPFIEGDGTGPDIWRASVRVFDAAVQKAYGGKRKIQWKEVLAGQKSFDQLKTWLPDETVEAFQKYLELQPNGQWAAASKEMLTSLGGSIETKFTDPNAPATKKKKK